MSDSFSSDSVSAPNLSNYETDKNILAEISSSPEQSENDEVLYEISEMEMKTNRFNNRLLERLTSLQDTMHLLKNQLREERELWKKEIEEYSRMVSDENATHLNSYENEDVNESIHSIDTDNIDSCKEYTISDYEQKLAKYQEALAKAQAEKRASLKRQIAISNYKRRLLEVENMCNLELLRVKQNVQFLQPLQMMASEWNKDVQDHGDEEQQQNDNKEIVDTKDSGDSFKNKEILSTENITNIGNIGNKLYNDMNEMFSKISNTCFNKNLSPLSTSSSVWNIDDDVMGITTNPSNTWYPM